MITLPGVTFHSKIYESLATLVYRGTRERENCAVIAKILKQDYPSLQELTRYRQEYEITRSLNLEGVVKTYSQQDYQRTLVILLEDFGGESLEYWMRQQSDFCPMPLSIFLDIAIALTDTLGKLHAAHVIHKDINPGNIVLNPTTGVVKLIDFGIATRFSRTNPTFKNLHLLEGTPAYVSPEQTGRMNRRLDYRTDFYSLGVTFYELLTGQLPFPTQDILELVHCHIARPPIPPHELNARIPQPISDLILKLMAKNAEDRYQSAWGIKADLERCAQQLEAVGRIESMPLGVQDVSEQFCIPQKLYGRAAQMAALLAAFNRVAGSEGVREMMLVSGDAGVGKTVLVQELYKPITQKRGYFIWGKFDQFRRNIPYSAIVDALQKLVQQLLGEPDEQLQQWRSRLLTALGSNGQVIIDVIPEVEFIIGKQPSVPEVGATESQNRFNLTFQKFVRVFCAKEHPLVIFLDDLQWIDSATLKFIELILLDEQAQSLFLIGAYRANEVSPTHPLMLTLESLRNQGAMLQHINLTSLTLESLSHLLAETLHHTPGTVHSLAQTVARKTEGNPFFVGEFLKLLDDENLLTFDAQQLSWQWNLAEIEAQEITDNVVELLLRQLQKLSDATQQILSIAACVESEFDLETLTLSAERDSEGTVCEKSPQAISQDLLAAVQAGLIQPLSELDENLLVQEYKFSHDRVQQAAYALIDESQKQVVHLQIGRNLLEKTSPEQQSDRLFAIVDHLDRGIELVTNRAERSEIARLNLIAGQKAKAATAYEAASQYFTTGLKLLDTDRWLSEYDLTLALYSEAAGAAYLQGCFDEMEQFVEEVLNNAKTAIDKVQAYDSRIQAFLSQGNLEEVLKIGLEVLKLLGVILSENPSQLDVQSELEETTARLAGREIANLIHLPKMTAPRPLAAIYILGSIISTAFFVSPALTILITCKMVNLSISYGNAVWSPVSYAIYGSVLCRVIQDIELGYKFGKLALSLAERSSIRQSNAKALILSGLLIMHWKIHLRETIPMLVEAYQNGVETGDFEFAGYGAFGVCHHSFFVGEELAQLEQKTAVYSKAMGQIRREIPSSWTAMLWQTILNLLGRSKNPSRLMGSAYNEEALPQMIAIKDGTGVNYFYLYKIVLCYLFGEYHQAAQNAVLARQYVEMPTAMMVPLFCFYHSLALLSLSLDASNAEKAAWLSSVSANQEKIQKWAEHAPTNYLHKYHLVEAEKARVLGQFPEAEEFYEQAIAGAAENEYIQEEALAYELAARHYLARGREKFAQTYMKEAHYCYERWGAIAKVKDLETRYPQFFPQSSGVTYTPIHTTSGTTSARLDSAINLTAVMKAAQALSETIRLDQLIATLMQVVIENVGAERGALIVLEDAQLTVVAQCSGSRQCDSEKLNIADCATISLSVIHTVERTQATLVLDDAVSEASFSTDPYIQTRQTRSLLCMPILKQSQMIGILYLENNLSPGVFTSDRLQVLKLLMVQAAISLENACLYEQLEDYAETLERKVEERTQALQRSEAKFRNIFENSQVGIFRNRISDGLILNANQRLANLLGFDSPEEIIGLEHSIDYFVNPSDRQHAHELMKRDGELRSYEAQLRKRDGTVFWGLTSSYLNAADGYVEGVIADITDLKQAEVALQASEAELRALFSAIPDPLFIFTTEGQLVCAIKGNPSYGELLCREEGIGKTLHQLYAKEEADKFLSYIQQVVKTQQILTVEYSLWIAGREIWFSARIAPIRHEQVIWLARDITLQKQAEATSIVEERNRMAREIHDTLAQAFTGILIQVDAATQVLVEDAEATLAHLDTIEELARTGLSEARRSVSALRPQLLEDGDLSIAFERLVNQMRVATHTALIYSVEGIAYSLPAEVENHLLRIGQEALTNAIKYANANEISIELVYEDVQCRLQVKDDGQGFGVVGIPMSGGFGLIGMSERAERIGAHLTIESQPGQGTEIIVIVDRG
ncbi:AAA family ATPase [Leptolyngbya sp. NIES-2104]|uniref:AAA family ATPase n=1 Tax=Leptolyngbya sp. NIES-2104 TaxID=1552121 RepID=UPI0006ECAD63|nr:AAA family ATPase [Leptolyngbya sp. NIES-2104]GAP99914.1 high-affnity carbon uptake protein Hat/HatR [Leptolyngbya sp. NIES-2104]